MSPRRLRTYYFFVSLLVCVNIAAASWQLDATYMTPPQGVNERVYALGMDSSKRLIAGGLFTTAGGEASRGLARFYNDGTRDPHFDVGSGVADGVYDYITDLLVLADNSIIIVGDFGSFNGVSRGNIARIFPDGSVDAAFASGVGADAMIRHIEPSGDGGYIIGGNFSTYDGIARSRIAKLDTTGALDTSITFDHTFSSGEWIDQIEVFPNGDILAAGDFDDYNVRKFLANGTTDSSFLYDYYNHDYVEATLLTSTGKILIGGTGSNEIHCHNADGSEDYSFGGSIEYPAEVYGLNELPDGRIVAAGLLNANSQAQLSYLFIMNPDGSVDETALPDPFEPSGWVGPTLIDGEFLYFAGNFSSVYAGTTQAHNRIARINMSPVSNPPNAVYFDRSSITLFENDYVERSFNLMINGTPREPVTVTLGVVEEDPSGPIPEFPTIPNPIQVPMDGPSHTEVTLTSTQDNPGYQGTRRVKHRILSVQGDAVIGEPSEIDIILIDDEPHPNVRFAQASFDLLEGGDPSSEPTFAEILFDSQPEENVSYQVVVESDEPELLNRTNVNGEYFSLYENSPHELHVEFDDDQDDQITGPRELTLRIVPDEPEGSAYLGTPATMTLRILDNEVVGGIRFSQSSLDLVTNQDEVDVVTLVDGVLHQTGLIYEVEYDDPQWEHSLSFQEDLPAQGPEVSQTIDLQNGNGAVLSPATARLRVRTDPDQPALLGEPSVLELKLYDERSLEGWTILQYPETHEDPQVLTLDDDKDGQNVLLEWLQDTDPHNAADAKFPAAVAEHMEGDQRHFSIRFYYSDQKPGYACVVEQKGSLLDAVWTTVWRSDEDPNFDSELVLEPPFVGAENWAEIRLPEPMNGAGFVRIRYESTLSP